jgi:hypothetical protein
MNSKHDVFWSEPGAAEHAVLLYDHDESLMASVEAFAADGLAAGEAVIVVATPAHLAELGARLGGAQAARGFSLDAAAKDDAYIALEADAVLSRLMVGDRLDERLFDREVRALLSRARGPGGRRVRAFGEMVALLWARGNTAATIELERLWCGVCAREPLLLYCAYPRAAFAQDPVRSIGETCEGLEQICSAHTRVFSG